MGISIVYEDDDILALNKPSGMLVHGAEGTPPAERIGGTVADWVLARYPEMEGVGEPMRTPKGAPIPRPGIVHRLDKDTSGILVLAKTQDVFEFLKKSFQDRTIEKEYKTIVYGRVEQREGEIDMPIGRSPEDFRRKSVLPTARGEKRESQTRYKTEARNDEESFLSVFPKQDAHTRYGCTARRFATRSSATRSTPRIVRASSASPGSLSTRSRSNLPFPPARA